MNQIWEFFFCPYHGIFRPDNWSMILSSFTQLQIGLENFWLTRVKRGE